MLSGHVTRNDDDDDRHLHMESVSFWTLNVTVLRVRTQQSLDYISESDMYVLLSLPTATATTYRTKTISNNNNPEWNETFTFRVPVQIKNVLEIQLYDEDPLSADDLISTVLLDISTLDRGDKETKSFTINPETEDELQMEFELLKRKETSQEYLSNGILMAPPLTVLDVGVDKLLSNYTGIEDKFLKVMGAYEETKTLDLNEDGPQRLRFYVNGDLETVLGVTPNADEELDDDDDDALASSADMETFARLKPLPANHTGKVSLVMDEGVVDLDLQTKKSEGSAPRVRMEFDTPPEEKEFLKKRKVVVAEALRKLVGLSSALREDEVPSIAVVGSGGGARAMTGLLGGLKALKDMGVLDAVSYITGVSGSTWAMSALYQDANWSQQDMDGFISAQKEQMTKGTLSAFSPEKMHYYHQEMEKKETDGHLASFTDMAGLVFEHLIFGKEITSRLSEQQETVSEGQNPLPIYTAVNMKEDVQGTESAAEWCEFTPYEVGLLKYGAFVPTEHFGSHYFLGRLVKKLPELRLPYLIGIWSSAYAVNLTELWKTVTGAEPSWTQQGSEIDSIESDTTPSTLDTFVFNPVTRIAEKLNDFFSKRAGVAEMFNYMRGLFLHWNYNKYSNFVAWRDTHPDAYPNQLTPSDSTLHLVDSGHAINIGCAPILRPDRDVDVIIVLSYSWDPDHALDVIRLTSDYCKEHQIPFPNADYSSLEKEPEKEVYIFEDRDNPKAPVVIHFPLVNVTYKDFKRPGVRRETEEEIKAGHLDVKSRDSPYTTKNFTYSEHDYDALVDLAYYNVINNKESICSVIRQALQTNISNSDANRCNMQ